MIWRHGHAALPILFKTLKPYLLSLSLYKEDETNNEVSFSDVLLNRKNNVKMETVYTRKPTHTNQYLHQNSNHHPVKTRNLQNSHRTHIKITLLVIDYSIVEIRQVLHPQ